ncbi:MAG TPA: transposase, partial [Methylocella sp.]|nr:transposase [Methylocella sp.]
KIMAIVDRHGLPLSVSTHAANHHEVRLVQLCFDFYMIEAKPENLIGDRAYDSDPLNEELRRDGIEMIAPHRSNRRKPASQDGRRFRRYARRWLVERFFAWIQWQRRILVRSEYDPQNDLPPILWIPDQVARSSVCSGVIYPRADEAAGDCNIHQ